MRLSSRSCRALLATKENQQIRIQSKRVQYGRTSKPTERCISMRMCACDVTESERSNDSSSPELESLNADVRPEEQSSCSDDDRRADVADGPVSNVGAGAGGRSPTEVVVVRVVSVGQRSPVHPQSERGDAADRRRKVGVAARFVTSTVSTPCPGGPKPPKNTVTGQSGRSRGTTATHQRSSTSPSSSSSTSGSLPDGYCRVARCLRPEHTSERDEQRLVANCRQLNDCQFYVAELSSSDAKQRLRCCPPGTFLVRDSAHPRHLYSLTVKTPRGVTSIRTVYDSAGFRLDTEPDQVGSKGL